MKIKLKWLYLLLSLNGLAILLIFNYYDPLIDMLDKNYLQSLTNKTEAIVIKYDFYPRHRVRDFFPEYEHYIDINYEINGEKYKVRDSFRGGKKEIWNPGEKMIVLYNPNSQKQVAIPEKIVEWQKNNKKEFKTRIIIPTIIEIILFLMFINKKRKIKLLADNWDIKDYEL